MQESARAFQTCKLYWKAVEEKVWTRKGDAEQERKEFYKARLIAATTLEKLSPEDAARAVLLAMPLEHLVNFRWFGDSTDPVANLVSDILKRDALIIFASLAKA